MDPLEKASTWVAVFVTFVFALAIIVACVALIWAMVDVRLLGKETVIVPMQAPVEQFKRKGGKKHGGKRAADGHAADSGGDDDVDTTDDNNDSAEAADNTEGFADGSGIMQQRSQSWW